LTNFIGREQELREIVAFVRDQRFVTLAGAGGVGKTRCALEISAQLLRVAAQTAGWGMGNGEWHYPVLIGADRMRERQAEIEGSINADLTQTELDECKLHGLLNRPGAGGFRKMCSAACRPRSECSANFSR